MLGVGCLTQHLFHIFYCPSYYKEDGTSFEVEVEGNYYGFFDLPIYGKHMLLDALAVIAICYYERIDAKEVSKIFKTFKGAKRRFSETVVGENIIIDDYAHHPNEAKATLKATFTYVDPAPYEWNTGTTHTHSYTGYNWEAAHPHKCYKTCSTCGATKYIENEYYKVSTCSQCSFTQDSKYGGVKGFKAYPCVTSNFEVKTSDLSTRGGEIYTTDYCTINELYTNGWCKVTFPLDSGGTKTAYTKISNFIK